MKFSQKLDEALNAVMYHGSPDPGLKEIMPYRGDWGYGVYLTTDIDVAWHYSRGRKQVASAFFGDIDEPSTGTVYVVANPLKNPLIIKDHAQMRELYRETLKWNDEYGRGKSYLTDSPEGISELAKERGHDGVIDMTNGEVIYFSDVPIPVIDTV